MARHTTEKYMVLFELGTFRKVFYRRVVVSNDLVTKASHSFLVQYGSLKIKHPAFQAYKSLLKGEKKSDKQDTSSASRSVFVRRTI